MKKIIRQTTREKIFSYRRHDLSISAYSQEMRINLNGLKKIEKHLKDELNVFFDIYHDTKKNTLYIEFNKKGSFVLKKYKNREERRCYVRDLFDSGYKLPQIESNYWHHKESRLFILKEKKDNLYILELCKN